MRATDSTGELPVPIYELVSAMEVLGGLGLERMLAGLSTRRYPVGLEPVGGGTVRRAGIRGRTCSTRRSGR